ncbi:hypothetical protein ALNOE001_12270 [Candidatus Methanobinarius endosymbioticus]|uniref:Uncharacterized protein n=1 Tax=Candidatus Methanobinarius endosymbioticus TaxID=2006182 RepID=A0A366MB86_9EURY|nr:hypothetical protein ALNOE001_12270 [Candidatus Methanobinarius endosymbioticus]
MVLLSLSIVINEEYSISGDKTAHNIELNKASAGSVLVNIKDSGKKIRSKISSTKYNENGKALKDATVKIYKNNVEVKNGNTNSSGQYKTQLEDGNYTFRISYSTYKTHVKNYEIIENKTINHYSSPRLFVS